MAKAQLYFPNGQPIPPASVRNAVQAAGAYLAADRRAPEFQNWNPSGGSAAADLSYGAQQRIAHGARDLERNDGHIAGAVRSHKERVIGAGLRLRSLPDHRALGLDPELVKDKAREIEAIHAEWADNPLACDTEGHSNFGGLTAQAEGSWMVQGEALSLLRYMPQRQGRLGSRFGTVVQMVETDRLMTPYARPSNASIVDGVELDRFGSSTAFHIASRHPGEVAGGLGVNGQFVVERKPRFNRAGMVQVIHLFEKRRPGQHRGVSVLAPVMDTALQRKRYNRAELSAAVVNAVIAAVLETPLDGDTIADLFGDEGGDTYLNQLKNAGPVRFGLGPGGQIPRLFPGEKLSGFQGGRPNQAFGDFVGVVDREIAAATGGTYETFTRDFSKTNYSSARASLMEAWRFVMSRRLFISAYWCNPVFGRVMDEAVLREYIDLPGYREDPRLRKAWLKASWLGPGIGWIDPVKEIQAAVMRIVSGMSSLSEEAALQGNDLDLVVEQLAVDLRLLKEKGIELPDLNVLLAGMFRGDRNDEE